MDFLPDTLFFITSFIGTSFSFCTLSRLTTMIRNERLKILPWLLKASSPLSPAPVCDKDSTAHPAPKTLPLPRRETWVFFYMITTTLSSHCFKKF